MKSFGSHKLRLHRETLKVLGKAMLRGARGGTNASGECAFSGNNRDMDTVCNTHTVAYCPNEVANTAFTGAALLCCG